MTQEQNAQANLAKIMEYIKQETEKKFLLLKKRKKKKLI